VQQFQRYRIFPRGLFFLACPVYTNISTVYQHLQFMFILIFFTLSKKHLISLHWSNLILRFRFSSTSVQLPYWLSEGYFSVLIIVWHILLNIINGLLREQKSGKGHCKTFMVGLCENRIIPKIKEYREFFTAFHEVMLQLMSILGKCCCLWFIVT